MAEPTGSQLLDDTVAFILETWPELAAELSDERIAAWAEEINSGTGRTVEQIRNDIFEYVVTRERVAAWAREQFSSRGLSIGTANEEAGVRIGRIVDELMGGDTGFHELESTLNEFGTVQDTTTTAAVVEPGASAGHEGDDSAKHGTESVGEVDLPVGMRLVKVTNPSGSDADAIYYAVGTVFGVDVAYEIGDSNALNEMFGSTSAFDEQTSMNQGQFDESGIITVGSIDEIAGSTESLQAQYERDLREAGFESPPAWMQADKTAMAVIVTAANEGWSAERTWVELAKLDSFKTRYPGLDTVMKQMGTTSFVAGIAEYASREAGIRSALLATRGPNADTSPEYVSSLVASGWQPEEVEEILSLEQRVKDNPEALDNINEILAYQGLDPMTEDDFVQFLQDQDALEADPSHAPSDVFEAVNDALRMQALIDEGLDVSTEFASELGTGSSGSIQTQESYSRQAQLSAQMVAQNIHELDIEKMGLTREDVISAMFGEARDGEGGKTVAEINGILEKFGKERANAAQGFSRSTAFVNKEGRLVTQGFSNI